MLAANKVNDVEDNNELIKKCRKLSKTRQLFKSQKLAKSEKKLLKVGIYQTLALKRMGQVF